MASSSSKRLFSLVFSAAAIIGCKSTNGTDSTQLAADPPPPTAPVVAVLSPDGRIAPEDRAAGAAPTSVRVVQFGPEGVEQDDNQLRVRFSQPMKPSARLVFETRPPLAGTAKFVDAFTVAYILEEEPPRATEFAVRAHGTVVSKAEQEETIDLAWTFATVRPTATLNLKTHHEAGAAPGEKGPPVDWDELVHLTLSQTTSNKAVRKALSIRTTSEAKSERSIAYRLTRDPDDMEAPDQEAHWFIAPRGGHWPSGSTMRVVVDKSLTTGAGPLSIGESEKLTFSTVPGLKAELRCIDDFAGGCSPNGLHVEFGSEVSSTSLRRSKVSPRPKNHSVEVYGERTASSVYFYGDFEVGKKYTVTLPSGLTDHKGQKLVSPRTLVAEIVPPSPTLTLTGGGTLMGSHAGTVGIETRYLKSVDLEIDPLSDAELAAALLSNKVRFARTPTDLQRKKLELTPHGAYHWDAHALPVADLLGTASGAAIIRVSPGPLTPGSPSGGVPLPRTDLYQLTQLGVVAGDSEAGSFVRVAQLDNAKPIAGARASVWTRTPKGMSSSAEYGPSDADGIIQLPAGKVFPDDGVLVVKTDTDRFGLSLEDENLVQRWRYRRYGEEALRDRAVSELITERPLYQPGEDVRVIGWLARGTASTESRLRRAKPQKVEVRLLDQRKQEVARRTVRSKAYGKYWAKLRLPPDVALGSLTAEAKIGTEVFSTRFRVREFKIPTFVVAGHVSASDVPHGDVVVATAQADYLHGMGVPLSKAVQKTRCSPGYYRPPGAQNLHIARPTTGDDTDILLGAATVALDDTATHGRISFGLQSSRLPQGGSRSCGVSITIYDAAHEAMGSNVHFTVHPTRYLTLSALDRSPMVGRRDTVTAGSLDYEGHTLDANGLKIEVFHVDREKSRTRVASCRGRVRGTKNFACAWTPSKPGQHEIVLTGTVDDAKVSATNFVYAQRRRVVVPVAPRAPQIAIVPSVERIKPGEDIQIALESPRKSATGLVVRSQAGIRSTHPIDFVDHRAALSLRAKPSWVPTQYVDLLATLPRTKDTLPLVVSEEAEFEVLDVDRRLSVAVDAPRSVGPGDAVQVAVAVRNADGDGVQSHVAIWAVDEAILALAPWNFPDLVSAFAVDYGRRVEFFEDYDSLVWEYHPRGDPLLGGGAIGLGGYGSGGGGSGYGAGAGGLGRSSQQIRSRFETTPIFVGDVKTDTNGLATIRGEMPENLTTFRIAAVASAELSDGAGLARFGIGEGRIQVTSPFSVRPIVPSVLRPGDRSELSAMVNNMTDKVGKLEVRFELSDATGVLVAASKAQVTSKLTESQHLVPFAIEAKGVGTATVRAFATLTPNDGSAVLRDAMEVPLAVVAERTLVEHAAIYGSMPDDGAIAVNIDRPTDVATGTGKLELSTHTSLLGGYQDNVQALVLYPYGCVEQTSTRLIPLLALGDLASRYPLGVERVDDFVYAAISRLSTMQTRSGGFSYWSGGVTPHFYASAYATWVLTLAADAGHPVPPDVLERAQVFLAAGLAEWSTDNSTTDHEDARIAMAMHALAVGGKLERAPLERMTDRFERLPTFAQALVILAAHELEEKTAKELLVRFSRRIDVREAYARTRPPASSYGQFFDTPIRSDALALLAYATVAPTSPVTEKLARGIARARDRGQLRNTQENAYALVAMAAYSRVAEVDEPAMLAQAWVDDARVLDTKFEGRTFDFRDAISSLRRAGPDPKVTLSKAGAGRLYYRVGMEWSPATMPTEPKYAGIVIEKHMYAGERELLPGQSVAAGSQVTIDIAVTVEMRRDYVVVEVPIAAGLTAIDTSLGAGHGATGAASGRARWVDSRELRADRIVLFSDSLPPGEHHQRISLRATTPGRYAIPPARAEGMYTPEIYGYTPGDSLTVTR